MRTDGSAAAPWKTQKQRRSSKEERAVPPWSPTDEATATKRLSQNVKYFCADTPRRQMKGRKARKKITESPKGSPPCPTSWPPPSPPLTNAPHRPNNGSSVTDRGEGTAHPHTHRPCKNDDTRLLSLLLRIGCIDADCRQYIGGQLNKRLVPTAHTPRPAAAVRFLVAGPGD